MRFGDHLFLARLIFLLSPFPPCRGHPSLLINHENLPTQNLLLGAWFLVSLASAGRLFQQQGTLFVRMEGSQRLFRRGGGTVFLWEFVRAARIRPMFRILN